MTSLVDRGAELAHSGKYTPPPELPKGWIFASAAPPSRPVDWLVPNNLARGHVTYLFGEEGIGKSTWWVYILASRTRAGEYVLIIITEDGWEDTVRPRLEAAGADLSKVIMLNVADDVDEFEMGIPGPKWLAEQQLPPLSLVVIDGLADATAYANGTLPKATEWRPVITAWKRYAARHHTAVLALGHTNRDTLNGTRGAVGLSGQIRQVVRLNLIAMRTEDGRLAVGVEKSNICRTDQPVDLFEITEATSSGITVNICRPCGSGDATAREMFQVLAAQSHVAEDDADRERLDGCLADLLALLKGYQGNDGWAPTTEITDLLTKGKGTSTTRWSQSQIDRARTRAIKDDLIETDHPRVPGPHYWRARLRDWD